MKIMYILCLGKCRNVLEYRVNGWWYSVEAQFHGVGFFRLRITDYLDVSRCGLSSKSKQIHLLTEIGS